VATNTHSGDSHVVKLVIALSRALVAPRGNEKRGGDQDLFYRELAFHAGVPPSDQLHYAMRSVSLRVSMCSTLHGRCR